MRLQAMVAREPVSRRAAFTLMEVMVVVAILVVLAGVAGVFVFRSLDDANIKVAKANIKAVETACQQYKLNNGDFPQSLQELIAPPTGRPYLQDESKIRDPWGREFQYNPQGNGNLPEITCQTPDGQTLSNLAR
jgi:general secretion pathway protein G